MFADSVFNLYGLVRNGTPIPPGENIEPGLRLSLVRYEDIAAVVSCSAPGDDSGTVWRHHEILRRIHAIGDVVPLRVGTSARGLEDVVRILEVSRARIVRLLDRFGDKDEWTLTLLVDSDAAGGPLAPRPARRIMSELLASIAGLGGELTNVSIRHRGMAGPIGSAALLLSRADGDELQALVSGFNASRGPGVGVRLTGPWPPYVFAEKAHTVDAGTLRALILRSYRWLTGGRAISTATTASSPPRASSTR